MALTAGTFFSQTIGEFDPNNEAAFYGALKMRNGTFKLTRASRFSQIENDLGNIFAKKAGAISSVLDVGASTGITTLEFADFLKSKGSSAKITATDLFIDAHIVCLWKNFQILVDRKGWPLQYDVFGIAVRPWIRRLDYATLAFIPRMVAHAMFEKRAATLIAKGQSTPVKLISKRLISRPEITFIENDIFQTTPELINQFDLIRAANILNKNYFSNQNLSKAIDNIRSYLRSTGGLLLVTRTNADQKNSGTLFELDAQKTFRVLARIGAGSEIEDLVLGNS
jgi:SAM-dependent methyltransferase